MTVRYFPALLAWLVVSPEWLDLGDVRGWHDEPVTGQEHVTQEDAEAELARQREGV